MTYSIPEHSDENVALNVEELSVVLHHRGSSGRVLRSLELKVQSGEIAGVVGETGAGKSMTARAILRLLPANATITGGRVLLRGTDLLSLDEEEMRRVRGRQIAMMFQNPRESLNPVFTVRDQMETVLRRVRGLTRREAETEAEAVLRDLGLTNVRAVLKSYPHQLSGGMAQRVLIGLVLACDSELLIADEPATGLDAATQTRLLLGLEALIRDRQKTALIITHDIALVGSVCDSVAVMYAGQIVERGPVREVLESPRHPYTQGLVAAANLANVGNGSFIRGTPPTPFTDIPGCPFHPRCPHVMELCVSRQPLASGEADHFARCHLVGEEASDA